MIVKNEAETLPKCLASVQNLVDEMIVLDTGSTDETVKIAEEWGAIAPSFNWVNDFAAARNAALQHVTGDWVLVLDADEQLAPEAIPAVKDAIQSENTLVVNLIRQEIGATQSPYSLVSRLFRKHPDIHFTRPYHAMIDDSVAQILQQEPQWQIQSLPQIAILHEGYQPGAIASRDKLARAEAAMSSYLADHPNDAYVCSKLGALYVQQGRVKDGVELLQRGLQDTNALDPGVAYELHYHLGIAYRQQGDPNRAVQHYQTAIQQRILPSLKLGALNNLGAILQAAGHLTPARQLYEQVIQVDPTFAPGHYNLGMVRKGLGDLAGAIAAYERALELHPSYADAYQNLGVVYLKLGRVPESLDAFRQAITLHDQHNPAEAQRLRQGLLEMGFTP
ncbi:MAG: tetratricopeptide repeat protein [Thainema sp.]